MKINKINFAKIGFFVVITLLVILVLGLTTGCNTTEQKQSTGQQQSIEQKQGIQQAQTPQIQQQPQQPKIKETKQSFGCTTDNDCVRTGCSGTICQPAKAEPIFSTCEYLPKDDCYNEIPCSCINERCTWKINELFSSCMKEKQGQKSPPMLIV